ncbi:hypothetical protein BDY21DRAFT_376415 [Lineolata rhizophorae]|uniref:Uncharacterized protein n=1 Tax=Lineolata rhizophorae TaxID=578093 RepID=A0A6A6PC15_9PEZI|nr:hypothetical protein BDY21DRAFT_376415 [Lineolata rhizophorae]
MGSPHVSSIRPPSSSITTTTTTATELSRDPYAQRVKCLEDHASSLTGSKIADKIRKLQLALAWADKEEGRKREARLLSREGGLSRKGNPYANPVVDVNSAASAGGCSPAATTISNHSARRARSALLFGLGAGINDDNNNSGQEQEE